jgi:MFS family permease
MPDQSRSLFRHRDFLKLWTGETVSVFGDAITMLAVPIIAATVLNVTAFEFALLTTMGMLPFIFLSLPAGVWVDRLRRRPILIVGDLGRALALATIPVAFAFDVLTIWQLYAVALVVGTLTVFFDVAYQSYLPSLVDRDQLVDGNAKLQITQSAAQILGPGMAGGLIQLVTAPFAMLLDALSFLCSAAFVAWIRKPEPPIEPHDEAVHGPKPSMRSEMAVGLRYVTRHPWLRPIAATTGLGNFFGNVAYAIFVLYLVRERGLTAGEIGLAFSLGSFGVLLGALVASRSARVLGLGRTLVFSQIVGALEWLLVAALPNELILPAVIAGVFIGGFSSVVWNVNQVSLRQAITPPRMQGRMNASMRFIVWGTIPVGALLGGVLGTTIGLHETIWVAAIGGVVALLPVALSPVRSLERMPEAVGDEAVAATT